MATVVDWCVRVRECVCVCVLACVRDVFAIYDNNILPMLIMIRIKIIFLYFIEITRTHDFPSTGTRIVSLFFSSGCSRNLGNPDSHR